MRCAALDMPSTRQQDPTPVSARVRAAIVRLADAIDMPSERQQDPTLVSASVRAAIAAARLTDLLCATIDEAPKYPGPLG